MWCGYRGGWTVTAYKTTNARTQPYLLDSGKNKARRRPMKGELGRVQQTERRKWSMDLFYHNLRTNQLQMWHVMTIMSLDAT